MAAGVALHSRRADAYSTEQLLQARLDPRVHLQTIETPHFRIHHAPALADAARELARIAEPVHRAVSARLGGETRPRTDIVLVSTNDRTQAFTVTYPTTQIFMNEAPPHLSQGVFHYGDWLRWLLVHEYTHVVHLDRVAGAYRLARPLLGTFDRPNMLQPPWWREGLAVLVETELDSAGRADSTTYRMMFRAAQRAGVLGSADFGSLETASFRRGERWPWVLRSYLWGSALTQTIAGLRRDAIPRLVDSGAGGLPGLLGPAFARAGLPSPSEVQRQTVAWTRSRAERELAILARRPETAVVPLTEDGYNKFGPVISPDGSEIAFTRERPQDDNVVLLLSVGDDGRILSRRELFKRGAGYQLSYSRSGRFLAFDTLTYHDSYYLFSDLFLFDRDVDKAVLRSRGFRARDPDIHPDGVSLAFVQVVDGRQSLVRSDSGFGSRQLLYRPSVRTRLAQPRWSPDGERLVLIEHDERGGERLLLWERSGLRTLTDGTSQDRDPAWTPDGRHVLFSSDRAGTFQIYAIDVETETVRQVTHRYGGAFAPVADPRGRFLLFLDYSERGFDLVRADWKPEEWWTPDPDLGLPPGGSLEARGPGVSEPAPVRAEEAAPPAARAYSGWRHLAPLYLQPSISLREAGPQLGLATGGIDPAYHQHYRLTARWDLAHDTATGEAYYYDGRRRLPWTLEARRDVVRVQGGRDRLDLATADGRVFVPLGTRRDDFVRLGVAAQRYELGAGVQKLVGLAAAYHHDSLLAQPNDFVPETGAAYLLESSYLLRHRDSAVGLASARGKKPIRLPLLGAHSVLTTTVEGAWAESSGGGEYLFHAGGRESLPFSLSSRFELGGYEPNRLAADRLALARAHFTRPIVTVERSLATVPLYLSRVGLGLRAEAGYLERRGQGTVAWSGGVEILADTSLSHLWPLRFTLGVYRGRAENGGATRLVVTVGRGRP